MLEEGVGNHCHQGVSVKALPGSPLEVIEPQFFLQLLMRLFANPSRFDDGRQSAQVRFGRQVGEIIFFSPDVRRSPISQTSSPGRCCCPLSAIRRAARSALDNRRRFLLRASRTPCAISTSSSGK